MTKCNFKFKTHLWEFICTLEGKPWWSMENNPEGSQTKWMNLKSWSWELKFWTLLVLRRSGSHKWFPSCEKLSKTSLAWKSWLWVNFNTKDNYLGIESFVQFSSFKWRDRLQNWNVCEKLSRTGSFWKFWLLVKVKGPLNQSISSLTFFF